MSFICNESEKSFPYQNAQAILECLYNTVLGNSQLAILVWLNEATCGETGEWLCEAIVHFNLGRISSVGRAFDCRAGGRGFDSRGRTNTQGLKMTEK